MLTYIVPQIHFRCIEKLINKDCVIVFDELLNYPGFDGDKGELKAF